MKGKRFAALMVAAIMSLSLAACSPKEPQTETTQAPSTESAATQTPAPESEPTQEESQAGFTPGTYIGSAMGNASTITVEVTLEETSITDVKVIEENDTRHIAQTAIDIVPARIVEAQTVNVDGATGATLTSFGIKNAVAEALKEAGAYDAFTSAPEETELVQGEEEYYDLVIVGGGGSGLSAAAFAGQAGVESVLVLEKLSYTGGSTAVSGGGMVVGGSKYNEEVGIDFTPEEFLDFYKETAASVNPPEGMWINEDLVLKVGAVTGDTFNTLKDAGIPIESDFGPVAVWGDGRGLLMTAHFVNGVSSPSEPYHDFMTQYALDNGAEIRLNSTVTSLLTENGAVVGVTVQDNEKTYNVKAKKVILSCGGMEGNSELVQEYSPEAVGAILYACPGNTGDFLALTKDLEPGMTGYGSCSTVSGMGPVWINQEGERFVDESAYYYIASLEVVKQTGAMAWAIADSNSANAEGLEIAAAEGSVYKADTLEELADMIKVPIETLTATLEQYNSDALSGNGDSVYGKAAEAMEAVEVGPFYAQKVRSSLLFTMTSLTVNDNCQVTKADGTVIDNLYATGEVMVGNMFFDHYIASGSAVQNAIMSGRIAAEHAAQAISE